MVIALAGIAIVTALVILAFKSTGSGSPGTNAATQTLQTAKKKHHATKPTVVPATLIVTATTPDLVKLRLASRVWQAGLRGHARHGPVAPLVREALLDRRERPGRRAA